MILNHLYVENGKPLLVMVHGLLSSLETFLPLKEALTKHFSLLLVDQRGHGQSPPSGETYTAEVMAQDLKDLLCHLKIRKAHFLGHSMGARTVLQFGLLYPEMVDSMIIEDMGIHIRQQKTAEKDREKKALAAASRIDSLSFNNREDIYKIISPLFSYASDLMKSKVEEKENTFILKFWPEVSVLYGYQGNYTDLTPALTKSKFPVLFLIADPSVGSALTLTCIEHIKTHVPRAILKEIKGSWHNIHKTHPAEFTEAIVKFCFSL